MNDCRYATHRVLHRMSLARACSMLLVLLLAAAVQSCGRAPSADQPTPTGPVQVKAATVTIPTPYVTPEPTAGPLPSQSPLVSPAIIEVIDLGGPAIQGHSPLTFGISADRVYVANEGSGNVSIVQDGRVVTALALGQGPYRIATDSAGNTVYLAAEAARTIYVLQKDEIADVWPLTLAPTAITVSDGRIWVGGADGTIVRLDARSGQALSRDTALEDGMIVDLVSLESRRVLAATYSQVHLYAAAGAEIEASRAYSGYRALATAGNLVYVCAYDRVTGTTVVEELDGTSLALQRSLTVADDVVAIAVDARSDRLFVSGSVSNRVELIDMGNKIVLASAVAGLSPQRVALDIAADQLLTTFFESDTLVFFAAGDLSVVERVPLTLRVTALAPGQVSQGMYAILNTGSARSLGAHGQSLFLTDIGYPVALEWLPNGAGLAVLDRAATQAVLFDTDGDVTLTVDTVSDLRDLYVDSVAGDLYVGDTIVSLHTGATGSMNTQAGAGVGPPVQVLRDTRRDMLYMVALNGTPGSNGGYVVLRQEGSDWVTDRGPGRLSVLDIAYDEETDRFFSISGHMGEYGIQVYDPEAMREQHYVPLSAPPAAMLLNSPYHHLWIATLAPATGATPAHTVLTAYDTRVFSPVAIVRVSDTISIAAVDPHSGQLYLASGNSDLVYVLQDILLPSPPPGSAPTPDPAPDTPTATATATAQTSPTATPTAGITIAVQPTLAPRTATPTVTVLPVCEIPVQADLVRAWTTAASQFGCPSLPAMRENWGWQPFENGRAFWRRDTKQVLVALSDGAMLPFEDRWLEEVPDQPCEATPPEGLWQPIRGFGLVWCQEPGVRDGLGWAMQPESVFLSTFQIFGRGVMFTGRDQGVIWLDNQGTWHQVQP